jgi:hypothetical protein
MKHGRCKLCLQEKPLRKSHFIGKALYRIAGRRGGPVVTTPAIFFGISDQLRDYLLCGDCEHRFTTNGEDYVMRLVKHERASREKTLNWT